MRVQVSRISLRSIRATSFYETAHTGIRYQFPNSVHPIYSAFQGITRVSNSWNSTAVIRPRMPMTTMPTNM